MNHLRSEAWKSVVFEAELQCVWRETEEKNMDEACRAHSTSPTVTCFLSGHASQDAWLQDMSGRFSRGKIPRSLSPISGEEGPANCLAGG